MARGTTPRQPSRSGRQDKVARGRASFKDVEGGRPPAAKARTNSAAGRSRPASDSASAVPSAGRGRPASNSASAIPSAGRGRPASSKSSGKYNPLAPERVQDILQRLDQRYGNVTCALTHQNAWQLLVATILSAQCTDVRVNLVTPELFRKYPTPADMAKMKPEQIEADIRSTGFYKNKSKSIVGAAKKLVEEYGGEVPDEMDKLLPLPGVARKTANVVLGTWFHKAEGVVVDTHVTRISRRLELTKNEDAQKIEQDLMQVIPRQRWILFSHQVIHHGRQLCIARGPKCAQCPLETICHAADKTWSTVEIHKNAR